MKTFAIITSQTMARQAVEIYRGCQFVGWDVDDRRKTFKVLDAADGDPVIVAKILGPTWIVVRCGACGESVPATVRIVDDSDNCPECREPEVCRDCLTKMLVLLDGI